jgi:predicted ATP-dependent serine protease
MIKKYNLIKEEAGKKVKEEVQPPKDIVGDSVLILVCGKPGDGKSTLIS